MSRGRRYENTQKLNMKKVFATIIAIIVIIMIAISLTKLLTNTEKTKDVSSLDTYIPVYENGKWGVIDNKGNMIVDTQYDEMVVIPNKNEDLFICSYDIDYNKETYKTRVVNKKGEDILTTYNYVTAIENTDGNNVWYEENILKYKNGDKYGLINFDGKKILDAEYDNIYALPGIEKSIIIEKDGKKGLIGTSMGEIIIPVEYADITNLSESYESGYIVKSIENKFGLIGADKSKILNTQYDEIKKISGNNNYVVAQNGVLQIIDSLGKVILDNGFESVEEIDINSYVVIKNGKYGLISNGGQDIIPAEYEDLKFAFSNYYVAKKDGVYGVIDTAGTIVVDFGYDRISYIKSADFFECEKVDFKTDIIDRNFNKVLQDVIISELNIDDGYLRIRVDSDYKYYNFKFEEKTNKEILATNTLFLVKQNGKYGYENKKGERIVDCIYDDAKEQNKFGYCAVKKDGLWGALKSDGTVVVEPSRNLDSYLYIDFISTWNRYNDLTLNAYTK